MFDASQVASYSSQLQKLQAPDFLAANNFNSTTKKVMIDLSHAPADENRNNGQNQGVIRKLSFNSQNQEAAIQEYLDSVQTQKATHSQKRLGR